MKGSGDVVRIAGRSVGEGFSTLVVAEIGNNHDGQLEQGLRLIEEAARCGVDAVKFQAHLAEAEMLEDNTVPPHFPEPRYQFVKRMSLPREAHEALRAAALARGVLYFCSPFSIEAVRMLEEVGVPCYKIASGEVTNLPMLRAIVRTGKPCILSTGMSTMDEIAEAVDEIRRGGGECVLMQCTSLYPAPYERLNLRAIQSLRERFGCPVGLSDHSSEIYAPVAAAALGACVIEKHFTLDRGLYGPDHKASLPPPEMAEMVRAVRKIERAMGDGRKILQDDPLPMREVFQKSIVSAVDIPEGAVIQEEMLTTKKPGKGISAARFDAVVGRRVRRFIPTHTLVREDDLE